MANASAASSEPMTRAAAAAAPAPTSSVVASAHPGGSNSAVSAASTTPSSASFFFARPSKCHRPNTTAVAKDKEKKRPQKRSSGSASSSSSSSSSSFGECPLCGASWPLHRLPLHASECQGGGGGKGTAISPTVASTINSRGGGCEERLRLRPSGPTATRDDGGGASSATRRSRHGPRPEETTTTTQSDPAPSISIRSSIIRSSDEEPLASLSSSSFRSSIHGGGVLTKPSLTGTTNGPKGRLPGPEQQLLPTNNLQQDLPPGLFLYEDFISQEEEELILRELDRGGCDGHGKDDVGSDRDEFVPWKLSSFNGTSYGKRWGVHCRLGDWCVTEAERPLPSFVTQFLLPRLCHLRAMTTRSKNGTSLLVIPNEANAIDYRKSMGHWLKSHVDDRHLSKEPIANLSLAGDCVMTYTALGSGSSNADTTTKKKVYRVLLQRRTLQVLTGPARYGYQHGIANADLLSQRRVSVTLRKSPLTPSTSGSVPPAPAPAAGGAAQAALPAAPWWKRRRLDGPAAPSTAPKTSSPHPIPGLFVLEDFVTPEEEAFILSELDQGNLGTGGETDDADGSFATPPPWKAERHSGAHREKRYGRDSDLWSRAVRDPRYPLPHFVRLLLLPRLRNCPILKERMAGWLPNEGNAIEYRRDHNSWLKAHVDDRRKHKEFIANLSLAGDCYMTFAPAVASASASWGAAPASSTPGAGSAAAAATTKVWLRRRTLLVLTGKARYEYTHGIDPGDIVSARRVSFTLRETV